MLATGIVGLPNVGKSTLFNALTSGHAVVENYPFTTIDSNVGMAEVPDERLRALAEVLEPKEVTPCMVEYFDIAGLVEGASRGEGLGNQFLGAIRAVDAVVHVVRCFEGSEVSHVLGEMEPVRDAKLIETELLLADLAVLEGTIERLRRTWKANPRAFAKEEERLSHLLELLSEGTPLRSLDLERSERQELKSLGLLSGKPMIFVANLGEEDPSGVGAAAAASLEALATAAGADRATVVPVSVKLEWEISQLEPDDRQEFLEALGLETSGCSRLVEATFSHLDLIRFYTLANDKLRAWELARGATAPHAAGKVHSDMEKGFVRAHVASYDEVLEHGGLAELHHLGRLRTEGREYEVQDGDVIEFLFSR